jgi:hypothetical protein
LADDPLIEHGDPFGRETMHPSQDLRAGRRAGLRTRLALAVALSLIAPLSSSAADLQGTFNGQAFGIDSKTSAAAIDAALSRVGLVAVGCIGTEGLTVSRSVAQLSVPGVLSAGTIAGTAFSDRTATRAIVQDVSTITGFRALGGLIAADAIKADATVNATPSAIALNGGNSGFTNLRIAGTPIPANVASNTKVPLPGFGTATLKRITKIGGGAQNSGSVRVEMLVVDFASGNLLGFPAGSRIIVGSAFSRFERTAFSVNVAGAAYGALATGAASKILRTRIGSVALINTGCLGTGGHTISASTSGVDADTTLSTDAVGSTGIAGPNAGATVVKFTSQIQNAWLLKGLVRAGSISVVAQDTLRNGKRASTASTQFNSLRVNGQAMSNPVPNTRVDIPGLGYVVLNEQHIPAPTSRARTEVNGLHAYITLSNTLGLAIGTELILGHAASLAFPVPDSGAGS